MRTTAAILLLVLGSTMPGCGGSGAAPTAPSTPTPPAAPVPVQLAIFSDSTTAFSTTDVRDARDQVVRFDAANSSLIWTMDGRSFSGFPVSGNLLRADRFFQVRFGTKDGERRAYFTEAVATTLCEIAVVGGQLVITPTTLHVPGS